MHTQEVLPVAVGDAVEGLFAVISHIKLTQCGDVEMGPEMVAQLYTPQGQRLAEGPVKDGRLQLAFEGEFDLKQGFNLFIGPADEEIDLRQVSAYRRHLRLRDWRQNDNKYLAELELFIPELIWRPWWPLHLCVSGHVRKLLGGGAGVSPVPYTKVEIFDVDREPCWWPWLNFRLVDILDKRVIRDVELMRKPLPGPNPGDPMRHVTAEKMQLTAELEMKGFNAQPDPPVQRYLSAKNFQRVGETAELAPAIARRLDELTITSLKAPWYIWPNCYYSKSLICETYTDCSGYFNCCFDWYPFHVRQGRLRFDGRPDIIVRLTQVIDGVETVIYMDPYTGTRWNSGSTHIDFFLDDERIVTGDDRCPVQPEGPDVFFTRIGGDEVFDINQGSGAYEGGSYANVAYGSGLNLFGEFGDGLTQAAPARFYRLTIAKPGGTPRQLKADLWDTRVSKATLLSESYRLGPVDASTVGGQANLYRLRNRNDFYWYNPQLINQWNTIDDEPGLSGDGLYTVTLEIFDDAGNKLDGTVINYLDGTVDPPAVLPSMGNSSRLKVLVDNVKPDLTLTVTQADGACGVVPGSLVGASNIVWSVTQSNGRLQSWNLTYQQGITGPNGNLPGIPPASSNTGLAVPVNRSEPLTSMTQGQSHTCAYALELDAYANSRNGYSFIHHSENDIAIAVEFCE